jgi:chitin synthase
MIGILDSSGFQNFSSNGFEEFCVNLSNERIHQFLIQEEFNDNYGMNAFMIEDGIALPNNSFLNNLPCLELLVGKENHNKKEGHVDRTQNNHNLGTTAASLGLGGISGLLDRDTAKLQSGATEATNANFLATLQRQFSNNQALSRSSHTYSFGINHFSGAVHYSVDMFLEKNMDDLSPDFVNLLRDGTSNTFISSLFQGATMATESHPKDDRTIVKAQLTVKPTRAPSMRRRPTKRKQQQSHDIPPIPELPSTESDLEVQIRKAQDAYENMELMTVLDQLYVTLRDIFFTISETRIYHVVHIRPNDTQRPNDFDFNRVRAQVKAFLIPELIVRRRVEYANYYTIEDFNMRYEHFLSTLQLDPDLGERDKVGKACTAMGWTRDSVFIGKEMIWLGFDVWKQLEDELRVTEKKERLLEKEALRSESVPVMTNPKRASGITVVSNDSASFSSPQQGGERPLMDHYDKEQAISDGYASTNGQFEEYKSYDDTGSYGYYSEAKTDPDASQWGEESEWGIHGLGEG